MTEGLRRRCELLSLNRNAIARAFRWESAYMYPLAGSVDALKGQQTDIEKLKLCIRIIKDGTGVFSNLRGEPRLAYAAILADDADPTACFERVRVAYRELKREFIASPYLPTAAFIVAQAPDMETAARRTKSIYRLMKSEHPVITGGEDCVFAALFALGDRPDNEPVEEMERCFQLLRRDFHSANAVQGVAQALTLSKETPEKKCARMLELYSKLSAQGLRYGKGPELAALGVLAATERDTALLAGDMAEAEEYLRHCKGFGAWGIGKRQRLMYAAIMASGDALELGMNAAAINAATAMIIAQQVAITAAVAASAASSASS